MGRRARRDREAAAENVFRVHRVAEEIAHGAPLAEVLAQVRTELLDLLGLCDCWLELPPFQWLLPRLERGGTIEADEHHWFDGGFVLPRTASSCRCSTGGQEVGRLVLIGDPDVAVTIDERVLAVALADQLGIAMAMAGPGDVERAGGRSPTDSESVIHTYAR